MGQSAMLLVTGDCTQNFKIGEYNMYGSFLSTRSINFNFTMPITVYIMLITGIEPTGEVHHWQQSLLFSLGCRLRFPLLPLCKQHPCHGEPFRILRACRPTCSEKP
ncbi:hypothetical protein Mapa_008746 [Marchantia paleacea]|nr:hypothetical protein Mapa_008746 [Marchantia paleacea]